MQAVFWCLFGVYCGKKWRKILLGYENKKPQNPLFIRDYADLRKTVKWQKSLS